MRCGVAPAAHFMPSSLHHVPSPSSQRLGISPSTWRFGLPFKLQPRQEQAEAPFDPSIMALLCERAESTPPTRSHPRTMAETHRQLHAREAWCSHTYMGDCTSCWSSRPIRRQQYAQNPCTTSEFVDLHILNRRRPQLPNDNIFFVTSMKGLFP
jgi:hypothetical protein